MTTYSHKVMTAANEPTIYSGGISFVYSANGYRGMYDADRGLGGGTGICAHEHVSPNAAIRCAQKTRARLRRENGIS